MAKGVTRTVSRQDPQTQQKRRSLEVQMLKSTTKQPTSHNLVYKCGICDLVSTQGFRDSWDCLAYRNQ